MTNPYQDELYHKTSIKPIEPPRKSEIYSRSRNAVERGSTLESNKNSYFSHSKSHQNITQKSDLNVKYRKDKQVAWQLQKPSFVQKPANVAMSDWKNMKPKNLDSLLVPASHLKKDSYCLGMVLDRLNASKLKVAALDKQVLAMARQKANPYEAIGSSRFMNRAAVKMASIDAIYNLSSHTKTFVDVCSGPGGFSEYLFWKLAEKNAKGWGITLKGQQDFAIDILQNAGSFTAHYGKDQTGDLYSIENVNSFCDLVLSESGHVDLVLGDGGFSVLGDELHQEEHSKLILVVQILVMLKVLKRGGNFVIKVFDLLTDFTVELTYLLYLHFEKISIIKPYSSRPANSERYLVCLGFQDQEPAELTAYLTKVVQVLNQLKPNSDPAVSGHLQHQPGFLAKSEMIDLGLLDLTHIFEGDMIKKDETFMDAIEGSNMKMATKQKEALDELMAYATDQEKEEWNQLEIAQKCCQEWNIPHK